jgi:hypothetical protein
MASASRLSVAALACALFCAPSLAQTPEPAVPAQPAPPKLDPKACTDRERLAQGDTVETDGAAPAQQSPSDQLARTGGVICPPPGLDPHIRAPAPHTGSDMPVIKPPAAGGDAVPQ